MEHGFFYLMCDSILLCNYDWAWCYPKSFNQSVNENYHRNWEHD